MPEICPRHCYARISTDAERTLQVTPSGFISRGNEPASHTFRNRRVDMDECLSHCLHRVQLCSARQVHPCQGTSVASGRPGAGAGVMSGAPANQAAAQAAPDTLSPTTRKATQEIRP